VDSRFLKGMTVEETPGVRSRKVRPYMPTQYDLLKC